MSRDMIFHSTALILSGIAVPTIAAAGYFVRYFGGDWGRALQIEIGVHESAQYVNASGGRMLVDSTPGKGTRGRLLLPTAARARPADPALQDVA